VLQCVAVCCSVLQCVAVCCSVLQCVAVCWSVLQCVAVFCSVLQCVAVCFSLISFSDAMHTYQEDYCIDKNEVWDQQVVLMAYFFF